MGHRLFEVVRRVLLLLYFVLQAIQFESMGVGVWKGVGVATGFALLVKSRASQVVGKVVFLTSLYLLWDPRQVLFLGLHAVAFLLI